MSSKSYIVFLKPVENVESLFTNDSLCNNVLLQTTINVNLQIKIIKPAFKYTPLRYDSPPPSTHPSGHHQSINIDFTKRKLIFPRNILPSQTCRLWKKIVIHIDFFVFLRKSENNLVLDRTSAGFYSLWFSFQSLW